MPQGDIVSGSALARGKLWSFDPESKPPPFGHSMKPYFGFHEKNVSLNHGESQLWLISDWKAF